MKTTTKTPSGYAPGCNLSELNADLLCAEMRFTCDGCDESVKRIDVNGLCPKCSKKLAKMEAR
jgi:Zn finger protein HypA/HybF involved in hydrogenase expression